MLVHTEVQRAQRDFVNLVVQTVRRHEHITVIERVERLAHTGVVDSSLGRVDVQLNVSRSAAQQRVLKTIASGLRVVGRGEIAAADIGADAQVGEMLAPADIYHRVA